MTHALELAQQGLNFNQIRTLEREERDHALTMGIVKEVGGLMHQVSASPLGVWLIGKTFINFYAKVSKTDLTGDALLFNSLAIANAAVNVTGQALPLISAIAPLLAA